MIALERLRIAAITLRSHGINVGIRSVGHGWLHELVAVRPIYADPAARLLDFADGVCGAHDTRSRVLTDGTLKQCVVEAEHMAVQL